MKPESAARPTLLAPILLILAACLLALAPSVFMGKVPAQTDWLKTYGPWSEPPWTAESVPRHNPGGGDDFFVYLPDRLAALNEWRNGRLPLWNPYVSGGVPFLGMQTANPLDPLILLELVLPLGYAMGLEYAVLLFLAGLGVVLYLRDQGLRNRAALALAGVAFALNPYFVVWLENRVFVGGLATLPLGLWALGRMADRGISARREAAVLALSIGYAALAGTLQLFALFLILLVMRLVWLFLPNRSPGAAPPGSRPPTRSARPLLIAGSVLTGFAIGILPLVAGLEMLGQSTRLGSNGYYTGVNFLHWRAAALWFSPEVFAFPAEREFAALGDFGRRYMSGSGWGMLGVVPLGLALFGIVRRAGPARERWFWGGLSVLTLGFLFLQATPIHEVLTRLLPWLDDVDLLRGLVVVNLGGSLLAGWGAAEIDGLWARSRSRRAWLIPWILYVAVGIGVVMAARVHPAPHGLARDLLPLLIPAGAVLVIGFPAIGGRGWARARLWLLVLLVGGELLRLNFVLNTFASPDLTYPMTPRAADLKKRLDAPGHPRFLVRGQLRLLPPNTGSIYGIPDVRGYSNIPISRYRLLLECAEGRTDLKNMPVLWNIDSPIYGLLSVGYVLVFQQLGPPRYEPVWDYGLHRRYDSLPRAFLVHASATLPGEQNIRSVLSEPGFDPAAGVYLERAAGPPPPMSPRQGPEIVQISAMTPTRVAVEVQASAPGMLVLSDPYYPGWRAEVDGKPARIYPAYWGLRGVGVGDGTHSVVFTYKPWWLGPGALATLAGLLAAAGALFIGGRRRT